MCDYSLEMYLQRKAVAGEKGITTRFPSGSIGLTDGNYTTCAVCTEVGSTLLLTNLSDEFQKVYNVGTTDKVEFIRIDNGLHRDGVRLSNGAEIPLHRLGTGVGIEFLTVPTPVIVEATDVAGPAVATADLNEVFSAALSVSYEEPATEPVADTASLLVEPAE